MLALARWGERWLHKSASNCVLRKRVRLGSCADSCAVFLLWQCWHVERSLHTPYEEQWAAWSCMMHGLGKFLGFSDFLVKDWLNTRSLIAVAEAGPVL